MYLERGSTVNYDYRSTFEVQYFHLNRTYVAVNATLDFKEDCCEPTDVVGKKLLVLKAIHKPRKQFVIQFLKTAGLFGLCGRF